MLRSTTAYCLSLSALVGACVSNGRMTPKAKWDDYTPGSIAGVVAHERGHVIRSLGDPPDGAMVISQQSFPTRAVLQYEDSIRPTPEARLQLIAHWVKAVHLPPQVPQTFVTQVLFREDTLDVWLPVQTALIPAFRDELRRGDRVSLWVSYVGAERPPRATAIDWVFVVNAWRAEVSRTRLPTSDDVPLVHRWVVIVRRPDARIDLDTAHVSPTGEGRRAWVRWSLSMRPADSADFQIVKWDIDCHHAESRILSTEDHDQAGAVRRTVNDSTAPRLPILRASPWYEAASIICRF